MKELSREEWIDQEVARLDKRISEMVADGWKHKWKRIWLSFGVLSAVVYFIALDKMTGLSDLLLWLIFAPLIAVVVMIASYLVLGYVIDAVTKDAYAIGKMEGRLSEIKLSKYDKE